MTDSVVIAVGLGSIVFLSMVLLALALFLRGQWDQLSDDPRRRPPRRGR